MCRVALMARSEEGVIMHPLVWKSSHLQQLGSGGNGATSDQPSEIPTVNWVLSDPPSHRPDGPSSSRSEDGNGTCREMHKQDQKMQVNITRAPPQLTLTAVISSLKNS